MNTFTFTDDQVELLVELVATADDSDQEQLVILSQLSKKLERKTRHIIGECGWPELKFNMPEISNIPYANQSILSHGDNASEIGPQELLMNRDSKEKSYPAGGGLMAIQMPSFDCAGNIRFNTKEK